MPIEGRAFTAWERLLLNLFSGATVESQLALQAQIAGAWVASEEPGHVYLQVAQDAPPLKSNSGFPIEARYFDDDGTPIIYLLHANFPKGQIHELDYWRSDGDEILERTPPASAIEIIPYGTESTVDAVATILRMRAAFDKRTNT